MTRSPSPSPLISTHSTSDGRLANLPDGRTGLISGRDTALTNAALDLWRTSPEIARTREERDSVLGNMRGISARGTQLLDDTIAATRNSEQNRREMIEAQQDQHRIILNHTLQSLANNLSANLNEARALSQSGMSTEGVARNHQSQNQMIMVTAANGLSTVADTFNHQFDLAETARANRTADISLMCDLLERNMRIQKELLQNYSSEMKEEFELKFRTIHLAIEFAQKVQEEICKNSHMLEQEKDNEARRQLERAQEQAARDKVMKELDMSQEAARRASDLLAQRESQAHRVKMEELSLQKSRDRMDHERRTKRYFSVWGFLFG